LRLTIRLLVIYLAVAAIAVTNCYDLHPAQAATPVAALTLASTQDGVPIHQHGQAAAGHHHEAGAIPCHDHRTGHGSGHDGDRYCCASAACMAIAFIFFSASLERNFAGSEDIAVSFTRLQPALVSPIDHPPRAG
jgi:hypothetical protein